MLFYQKTISFELQRNMLEIFIVEPDKTRITPTQFGCLPVERKVDKKKGSEGRY